MSYHFAGDVISHIAWVHKQRTLQSIAQLSSIDTPNRTEIVHIQNQSNKMYNSLMFVKRYTEIE